jgi:hypothetical protein
MHKTARFLAILAVTSLLAMPLVGYSIGTASQQAIAQNADPPQVPPPPPPPPPPERA